MRKINRQRIRGHNKNQSGTRGETQLSPQLQKHQSYHIYDKKRSNFLGLVKPDSSTYFFIFLKQIQRRETQKERGREERSILTCCARAWQKLNMYVHADVCVQNPTFMQNYVCIQSNHACKRSVHILIIIIFLTIKASPSLCSCSLVVLQRICTDSPYTYRALQARQIATHKFQRKLILQAFPKSIICSILEICDRLWERGTVQTCAIVTASVTLRWQCPLSWPTTFVPVFKRQFQPYCSHGFLC